MNRFRYCSNLKISLFVALIFCLNGLHLQAQAPQGINFQAVARDAFATPMPNTALRVRFTVKTGAAATVYQESHNVTTDAYGLFKAVLGRGSVLAGAFNTINWGASQHQVEIEINDGSGFTSAGNCLFESVPYALYAEKVNMGMDDLVDVDLTTLAPGQVMIWNGTDWVPTTLVNSPWSDAGNGITYLGGRVGVGVTGPLQTTFELPDSANVLFGDSLSGSGFKLIWYGAKGAMRFGYLTNAFGGYGYDKFWDYDSVGFYSFAAGQNSRAKGFGSFAFGSFGWADGSGSVAFFGNAKGNNSFTFGGSSKGRGSITFEGTAEEEGGIAMYGYTGGRYGVAIGGGTTGLGSSSSREDYAVAIGWNSDARGQASVALGPSDAYGYNSFSTGWVTEARGNYSSTFGYRTNSYPYASMALGRYNVINGDSAAWVSTDPVFIIGDGTADNSRSNSFLIQKNGQTSIGYNSPTGMLQVSSALGSLNNGGTLDLTHATLLLGTTATGLAFDPNQIEVIGAGLHLNFNSPEDVYLVNGGGNVGIGNSAPATRLDVTGDGWQFRLNNTAAGGGDWYIGSSATSWAAGAGKFIISPNGNSGNAVFAIEEADNQVGIGTLNPSDRLQVDADAGEDALRVRVASNTKLRVHSNGGVSVGFNSVPPVDGLLVNGDVVPRLDNLLDLGSPTRRWALIYAANGTIQTSDMRLKTGIQPLQQGLDVVLMMKPVKYRWKDDAQGLEKIGFIAQEMEGLLPEVVYRSENPDEPLGMNYGEVVPVLVRAIQEQQSLIGLQQEQLDQQQSRMDALQAELEALKAAVEALKK